MLEAIEDYKRGWPGRPPGWAANGPVRHLYRADLLLKQVRGPQLHTLTPDPPSSGQATTIWVPHDSGVDPPPGTITQARRK